MKTKKELNKDLRALTDEEALKAAGGTDFEIEGGPGGYEQHIYTEETEEEAKRKFGLR